MRVCWVLPIIGLLLPESAASTSSSLRWQTKLRYATPNSYRRDWFLLLYPSFRDCMLINSQSAKHEIAFLQESFRSSHKSESVGSICDHAVDEHRHFTTFGLGFTRMM